MDINQFVQIVKAMLEMLLGTEIKATETLKLNGTLLHSLIIIDPESDISPTIHLDSYYGRYLTTGNLEKTISCIIEEYRNFKPEQPLDMEWFRLFSHVKSRICYRLINYEANRDLLASIPHKRFLDLARIYYIRCQVNALTSGHITIYNSHLTMWGITADELDFLAENNTPILCSPSFLRMNLPAMTEADPGQPDDHPDYIDFLLSNMITLTNCQKNNGAAVICYEEPLQKFSAKTGMDTVILPSSIHETILLPMINGTDFNALAHMVQEINETEVALTERLSNSVYVYRKATGKIEIAREGIL